MSPWLLRRLAWMALTVWAVFTVSFILMRSVPGGPFDEARAVPEDVRQAIEARYHLDRPLIEQYFDQLGGYLRLDPGPSFRQPDYSVAEIIAEGLGPSMLLGALAISLALAVGILAGSIAALSAGKLSDQVVMVVATLGLALPGFVIAGLLVLTVSFHFDWLPPAGWGGAATLILPVICLALPHTAAIARLTRTGLRESLGQDWARTARAKGLTRRQVVFRHALRPALLPVVSYLGPATAAILTGSLVIEQIFAIPGLGPHFIQSALNRDYPLSMGVVILYTVLVAAMNLFADIAYRWLDPRVELR